MLIENMKLKDVTEEHLKIIFKWRNEKSIREVMYNSDQILWENHLEWFQSILKNSRKYQKIFYYNEIPYGIANFTLNDCEASVGEWGFYIGERKAPKGLGTGLAYKMLEFLFEDLKIRKICAEVIDFNERSIYFHKKVGFKQEGILRKQILKNNEYRDIHLFGYFSEDWGKNKEILEENLITK